MPGANCSKTAVSCVSPNQAARPTAQFSATLHTITAWTKLAAGTEKINPICMFDLNGNARISISAHIQNGISLFANGGDDAHFTQAVGHFLRQPARLARRPGQV